MLISVHVSMKRSIYKLKFSKSIFYRFALFSTILYHYGLWLHVTTTTMMVYFSKSFILLLNHLLMASRVEIPLSMKQMSSNPDAVAAFTKRAALDCAVLKSFSKLIYLLLGPLSIAKKDLQKFSKSMQIRPPLNCSIFSSGPELDFLSSKDNSLSFATKSLRPPCFLSTCLLPSLALNLWT